MKSLNAAEKNDHVFHYPGRMSEYECSKAPAEIVAILNNVSIISRYADHGLNTSSVTVPIRSNEPFRMGMTDLSFQGFAATICMGHLEFVPEPGQKYLAIHGDDFDPCSLSLYRETNGERERMKPKILPVCYDGAFMPGSYAGSAKQLYDANRSRYED